MLFLFNFLVPVDFLSMNIKRIFKRYNQTRALFIPNMLTETQALLPFGTRAFLVLLKTFDGLSAF